jgi:hypothetical protein
VTSEREKLEAAVRSVAAYQKAAKQMTYARVGIGEYGLIATYDDGSRELVSLGYKTALDAELHAASIDTLNPATPPPPRQLSPAEQNAAAVAAMINGEPPQPPPAPPRRRTRIDVVAMMAAFPSDALDGLIPGAATDAFHPHNG